MSSARNEGLKHVEGKYTVFFDADDLWDQDAFKKFVSFFDANYASVDLCSCKLKYLGNFSTKDHPLDYKFQNGKQIVDLEKNPKYICTTIGNAVFKSEALDGKFFDETMHYGEDAWFQSKIIAEKKRVGIIDDAVFYYRKNVGGGNASLGIINTEAWYFDIPKYYYLKLIDYSKEKNGCVPRYIQETLMFDIKWRSNNSQMVESFSEKQIKEYLALLREVLQYIDDEIILSANRISQFKKLYILSLKHDEEVINAAVLKDTKYYYRGNAVLNLQARSMISIKALEIRDGMIKMDGIVRATATGRDYKFYAVDENKTEYKIETERCEIMDTKGFVGEIVVPAERFCISVPFVINREIAFYLDTEETMIRLRPGFDERLGITAKNKNNYCVKDGYIIKVRNGIISFSKDTKIERIISEARLSKEMTKKEGKGWKQKRAKELKLRKAVDGKKLVKQAAFVTVRSDNELVGNMKDVYSQFQLPKEYYASKSISDNIDRMTEAAQLVYSSQVVVTDDYCPLFRDNSKRPGQYYVQLWHAAGAFKKFGKYGLTLYPGIDGMYHRDYDLVTTSSDRVSAIYADAFQIDESRIKALGVPRTDKYFDRQFIDQRKQHVYTVYPELKDKQVIVYAPTFREEKKVRVYLPHINYKAINDALSDDQVFVICPHPLMEKDDNKWNFDKIMMVQDVATSDMMLIADLLITDYSSIIFDYSLLNKPMAFFCYDYDTYERDFYLDYDSELPGEILKTTEELIDYLRREEFDVDERLTVFKEKFMSACDGHSTERVVNAIADYLK